MGEVVVKGPGGEGDTAMQEIIGNGGGRIRGSLEQSIDLEWTGGHLAARRLLSPFLAVDMD